MNRSVLLVDDDDDMRTSLRHLLADEGFHVYTARNGREAMELLQQIENPGLILLDLMMPVMNGSQFLTERGRFPTLAQIPVVIMSAWTKELRGETAGVAEVMTKPVNPDVLLKLIERYCDRDDRGAPQRR